MQNVDNLVALFCSGNSAKVYFMDIRTLERAVEKSTMLHSYCPSENSSPNNIFCEKSPRFDDFY